MEPMDITTVRRRSGLTKWALAHILGISRDSLSRMERGLKPMPFDLQLKLDAEDKRQQEKYHYGSARNIVNSLVGEGYSLGALAYEVGVTRIKVRHWQLGRSEPTAEQLRTLLWLPPPVKQRPRRRTVRRRRVR